MGKLTTFIYNFIAQDVNNSKSKNWLPIVLKDYKLKQEGPIDINLTPQEIESFKQSIINGFENVIYSALKDYPEIKKIIEEQVFFDTYINNPNPQFTIKNINVQGLENTKLTFPLTDIKEDENKYNLKFSLKGPAYEISSFPEIRPFCTTLNYYIEQDIAAYRREEYSQKKYILTDIILPPKIFHYDWPIISLKISGKLNISLNTNSQSALNIISNTTYWIKPNERIRSLQSVLNSINLSSDFIKYSKFQIYDTVVYGYNEKENNIFSRYLQLLLNKHIVTNRLCNNIFNILNNPKLRENLSNKMTKNIEEQFDKVLGVVDNELPFTIQQEKNAVDQYIFDRIRYALCSEKSDFCVHKLIESNKNPKLDPWSIGAIEVGSLNTPNNLDIRNVILDKAIMEGLSKIILENDDIEFESKTDENCDYVTLDTKLDLKILGNLKFMISGEYVDNCDFSILLKNNPIHIKSIISGDSIDNLIITIKEINIIYDKAAMQIFFKENEKEGYFAPLIEDLLNQDSIKCIIAEKINQNLAKSMDYISDNVTETTRKILNNANKTEG